MRKELRMNAGAPFIVPWDSEDLLQDALSKLI